MLPSHPGSLCTHPTLSLTEGGHCPHSPGLVAETAPAPPACERRETPSARPGGTGPWFFPMAAPALPGAPLPGSLRISRMPTVNSTTANTSPPILRLW